MGERSRLSQMPGTHVAKADVVGVALGTEKEVPIFQNKFGAPIKVTGVTISPQAAVTGDDTNNFSLQVQNKGLVGTGTDGVTAAKEYATGVDMVAFKPDALVMATALADVTVDDGEVLSLAKTEAAAGLALPDAVVTIEFQFTG